jgi:hypothetical protein
MEVLEQFCVKKKGREMRDSQPGGRAETNGSAETC